MTEKKIDSEPHLSGFNPKVIPWQSEVLKLVRRKWDYSIGYLSILLSGSYGSAKSCLMAHLIVTHCLENPGAVGCLARKGMPDLKKTILKEVLEHIEQDLVEGRDYTYNKAESIIKFSNGSEIICMSWSDKRYKKGRSLKISFLVIEEIVENDEEDKEAFDTLVARLGRLPKIKENVCIAATNPDSPAHWVYRYWIDPKAARNRPNRHVFYSLTEQNPFLPENYIAQLKADMSPKEADRFLRGKWIELRSEFIYYEYEHELDYCDYEYEVDENYPIHITYDFNIGSGKPLSCALIQRIDDVDHIFDEVVVEGFRTKDSLDELAGRMLLEYKTSYQINGDASGKNRDTRSKKSDFDIIKKYLANHETVDGRDVDFEIFVPASNPPVRSRHNWVNSRFCNDNKVRRVKVYKNAETADTGFRLTKLKKGAAYIECDSDYFQHITTAYGYYVYAQKLQNKRSKKGSRQL